MRQRHRRWTERMGRAARSAALAAVIVVAAGCGGQEISAPELNTTMVEQIVVTVPSPDPKLDPAEPDDDERALWVSADLGDDGNDGQTPERPLASLQEAIGRLGPGDTLYVLDGQYRELAEPGNAHYVVDRGGTAEAWIRITAAPGHRPEIVASNGNGMSIRADYVEVSDLVVTGEGFDTTNDYGWGILIRSSHHVRVMGNEISQMAVGGISSVESTNLDIVGNTVYENSFWGPEQGSGISLWHSVDQDFGPGPDGYHDRIVGNTVYRNENRVFSMWRDEDAITDGNGIIVDQTDETGYTGRILVANNLVVDNGGRAILVLESSRVDVMFNTTYANGRTDGLEGGPVELATSRADDVRFLNNVAWSRPGAPAIGVSDATDVVVGGNVLVTDSPSGLATEVDLVVDTNPGLARPDLDPTAADFRPVAGSSLIGHAVVVSPLLLLDADGAERSAGNPDAGAYELSTP